MKPWGGKGRYAYLVLSDKETEVQRCEEALLRLHSWPVEKVKHQGFGFWTWHYSDPQGLPASPIRTHRLPSPKRKSRCQGFLLDVWVKGWTQIQKFGFKTWSTWTVMETTPPENSWRHRTQQRDIRNWISPSNLVNPDIWLHRIWSKSYLQTLRRWSVFVLMRILHQKSSDP